MRPTSVLTPLCLAVTTAVTGLACAEGSVDPDRFELDEHPPSFEAHAGFEHQPEASSIVDPSSQPRLSFQRVELDEYERELGLCPYAVTSVGFPAISEDGRTIVTLASGSIGNGEADIETRYLKRFESDTPDGARTDLIYDRGADQTWDPDFAGCDAAGAAVLATVQRLDAELGEQRWRSLGALDAAIAEPDYWGEPTYFEQAMDHLQPGDRPVELLYHAGSFIARIPGVEVLQRTQRLDWRQWSDEFSAHDPHLLDLRFDPITRRALVSFSYNTGGCLSDEATYFAAIELSPAVIDAIERNPTAVFEEEQRRFLVLDYP
jgi:hypothetical protein